MKFSRNLKKGLIFGTEFKKINLEMFWKNYSSYNRIYMFLEYLIPKRMLDIFSIIFQESAFKSSEQTEPKFIFQPMSFLGIIYSIKVFTRDL